MSSSKRGKSTGKSPPMGKSNEPRSAPRPTPAPSSTLSSPQYACKSPLCRTPDVPLTDFESMEDTMRDLLWMTQKGPNRVFRERLLRREYADARLMERMILRFCCEGDSFEEVKRKMKSVEVEREMMQSVDDLFDDNLRAQAGKRSISTLLSDYLGLSLNEVVGLLQRTILAGKTPGDLWHGFCLHDVYRNKSTFEALVAGWDRQERTDISIDKVQSLWLEIRAGMLSGRIAGVGWTLEERREADIRSIFADEAGSSMRCVRRLANRIKDTAILALNLISPTMCAIVQAYCDISNDRASFYQQPIIRQLSNDIARLDLSQTLVRPPPPSSASPTFSPSSASPSLIMPRPTTSLSSNPFPPPPFESFTNPNPLEHLGPIEQPVRCCPPDKCSGQPPLEANYPLVEKLLESLFGFTFLTLLVGEMDVVTLHCTVGYSVAEGLDSLEVQTVEQRRIILEALPAALTKELQENECNDRVISKRLFLTLSYVKAVLLEAQKDRQPCLCDLTHLCAPLSDMVDVIVGEFSRQGVSHLSGDMAVNSQRIRSLILIHDVKSDSRNRRKKPDWKDHLKDFADFVAEPLAALVSTATTRVAGFDRSLALLMLLGPVRMLQEINYVDFADQNLADGWEMSCTRGGQYVVRQLHYYPSPITTRESDLMRISADKQLVNSKFSVMDSFALYSAAYTINPTDYLARLNCAQLRLRNPDRTNPDSEFSAVVCDCTMAIYYGPPSYKAYYRRGYALTQLKMWDKAIPGQLLASRRPGHH